MRDSKVERKVPGKYDHSIDEFVNLYQLRWLGYVLLMLTHRLSRCSVTVNRRKVEAVKLRYDISL